MSVKQGPFHLLELLLKSTHMLICKKDLHPESNFEFQKQSVLLMGGIMLFHQEKTKKTTQKPKTHKHNNNKISNVGIS